MANAKGTDALFYNPAGLARDGRHSLDLSMTAYNLRLQTIKDGLTVQFPDGESRTDLSATEVLPTPTSLVFSRNISPRIGFAYGVYVVESGDIRLDARQRREAFVIDNTFGAFDIDTGMNVQELRQTYLIGGGLGYQLSPRVRLGGGLFAVYDRQISNVQIFSGARPTTQQESAFILAADSADIKVLGLAPSISMQWDPEEHVSLGIIVRPPPFSVYTWGDRSPLVSAPGNAGGQVFETDLEVIKSWSVQPLEPLSAEMMISFYSSGYALGATFEIVPPIESTGTLAIDTGFQWNFRMGGRFAISEAWSFGLGVYSDRAVDISELTGTQSDFDYYGVTTGFTVEKKIADHISFNSTFGVVYALGSGTVEGVIIDALGGLDGVTARPQEASFHEITINLASGLAW